MGQACSRGSPPQLSETEELLPVQYRQPEPVKEQASWFSCSCCSRRCCAMCCGCCSCFLLPFLPLLVMLIGNSSFQMWALQNPDNLLSTIYLPQVSVIEGLFACNPAYLDALKKSNGENFVSAGQVVISSYDVTRRTLLAPQARSSQLGTQPLISAHFPDLDIGGRNLFLLSLSDKEAAGDGSHDGFKAAMRNQFFVQENLDRLKDETSKELLTTLKADYKAMPHGKMESFFFDPKQGLLRYLVKMLHHVMLGMDISDEAMIDKLMEWYAGDKPIAYYIQPFGQALGSYGSLTHEIAKIYEDTPAIKTLPLNDERYFNMTRAELATAVTQVFRIAGVTGTLQLAQTVLGGRDFPSYVNQPATTADDVLAIWDSLDLGDRGVIQSFILEAGRLYPPVTTTSHIALEEFEVEFKGRGKQKFPKGTKKLTTLGLAMLDPEKWPDPYKLDVSRSQDENMNFNSVGVQTYSRMCPGRELVLELLTDVLQEIGQLRRADQPSAQEAQPSTQDKSAELVGAVD
eukprot:TRINITY_DN41454_c0_g1_i1.p1 TRINITY_DN41454_c0_g1~~TRINITY_DN41454_c0_g1_i1.p1  ORF type:complete len:532 (-),score=97.40 TRINITY_DN41454_c0_g1_i1:64-1611(-)